MYKVKWSPLVIITTIVIAVVFLCIDVYLIAGLIYSGNVIFHALLLIIINAVLFFVIINTPRFILLNDERLVVKKVFGEIQIKYSDIIFAKTFNPSADLRVFGSGGFGGFIGKFSNNDYGWYSSYVLNTKQSFFISIKDNKSYAFSCENSAEVVTKINTYIK
ncbi:hypothetical protein FACS189451_03570 [Bacteroidia bacterium]|nr:hypothetical protein FACS189451_03570 [Bacteroidia bacterium]